MSNFTAGQRVRICWPTDKLGRRDLCGHPHLSEIADGALGQVVSLDSRAGSGHSVGVMLLEMWAAGTPLTDSFRADELAPA